MTRTEQIGDATLRVLDLFSGIGGFSLGLERTGGFKTVAFCEIEPFCQKVLKKHWPDVPIYHDIRELTGEKLRQDGIVADVVTGGFPCQDLSVAGRQAGIDGERSGLWSELCRIIGDVRPQYAIVENVANLLSGPSEQRGGWFGRVLGDLAEIGYDAEWHCIPASAVGAPHGRNRVWIVAYQSEVRNSSAGNGRKYIKDNQPAREFGRGGLRTLGHGNGERLEGLRGLFPSGRKRTAWETGEIRIGRDGKKRLCPPGISLVANGLPDQVDRIGGTGNAVLPQIPELIGRAILEAEMT